ncbi:MAG: Ig-like domain repeat protein, partial [Methanobrevibacter sp.]|nr:Ig-like domain repeat protein [Methanobrevibacter sp.]
MGGVSIKNTRILMLLMILTIAMITLGSVSASDIDANESLSMAEIDTIDISQENIKINENDIITDTPVGVSLDDDDVLSATYVYVRDKNSPDLTSETISVGSSINFEAMTTFKTYTYIDFGDGSKSGKIQTFANTWADFGSHTYASVGTYNVIAYDNYDDPSDVFTVTVEDASPYTLTIYDENNPDETTIKYSGENRVTLNIHSIFTSTEQSASQLQSLVGSTRPVIYVDGAAKGNGNIGYDGVTSTADSITLTKGQHTIYYVLPAGGDIENDVKSNELTVYVNLGDYYLRIYEEDGPDNTTFYYDAIYNFNLYNKLYNTLGLSGSEVKSSLYQSGDGYYNPVTYYVNGNQISDSRTGYGYRPAIWVDGTNEASSYSSYPNYIQWRPDSTGVYEIYAEYSATSALGTIRSDTITIYVGVEPPAGAKDTTLTLTNETPIDAKYGDAITITPNVIIKDEGTAVNEGDVTFTYGDGTLIDTIDLGESLTLPTTLTEGTYNIKAVYNGVDGTYNPSEEATITVVISKYDVTISSFEVTSPTYPANAVASIVTDTPGTYTVRANGKQYTITINEGETTGSVDMDVLAAKENYHANVTFTSTEKYNGAFEETDFAVNKGTTAVAASANETLPITYGDKIAVKGTSDVSGTIKVYENDKELASGNANEWIELPTLSAATHTLKLELINDDYDVASDTIGIAVNTAEIDLSIEVQNKVYPNEVTGTVRANVPGTYIVKLDGETKTTVVIDETGFNTFTFGVLDVKNNYNVSVSIDAIGNYSAGYDSKLFDVTVDGTTLTIGSSSNEVVYGIPISFTHEITPSTATGTIQFYYVSNNTDIGNPVNAGETLENIILPAGTHQIAAKYVAADDNYNDATSDPITVTINALSNPVEFDVAQNTVYDDKVEFKITNAIEGTYTIKFNVSSIPDLNLTVNPGESSVSDSILIPAGEYKAALIWKGDNYDDVNLDKTFTVSKGTNTVTISSSSATYPDEITINVAADLAGDYVITLNDTANTVITVNVGSSGSGSKSVKLASGSYSATTASNPDEDNYNLSVSDAIFTVNKGANNAELIISPETTLPNKVTIAINNAVAGDYIVSFNDSSVADVTLTVGDTGSASEDVDVPAGSYKATLSWTNDNYSDVNKEVNFNVVEENKLVIIWDNQHSQGQEKITCDEKYEISSICYTIDTSIYNNFATLTIYVDGEQYYGPTYGSGQSYYLYLYNDKIKFDKQGLHNITLLYSSTDEYWSNVLIYEVTNDVEENVTDNDTYETAVSLVDDYKEGSVVMLDDGDNISIA